MTIRTETAAPGFLVVSEVYEQGWRGYVDGEPVEVLPTNHALRGVAVPAGEHEVELRYEPRSLRLGLWISGILDRRYARNLRCRRLETLAARYEAGFTARMTLCAQRAARTGNAFDYPFAGGGDAQQRARHKIGHEPELCGQAGVRPPGLQPGKHLRLRDQPLGTAVLRHPPHEERPVRIARVVIPNEDMPARPCHADHLRQRSPHRLGGSDVVHDSDAVGEREGIVGKGKGATVAHDGGEAGSPSLQLAKHAARRVERGHGVAGAGDALGQQSRCRSRRRAPFPPWCAVE